MIIYNQLRISDDGKTLFINASMNSASYFNNMYISKITICTEDQVSELNPQCSGDAYIFQETYTQVENKRDLNLVLCKNSFNELFTGELSQHMFFVYIECGGTPAPDTPCVLDECTTLGVTFDYGQIFNRAMNYIRELGRNCAIPQNFIDFILKAEALKLSIETEHYLPAIEYWKRLIGDSQSVSSYSKCNCNG